MISPVVIQKLNRIPVFEFNLTIRLPSTLFYHLFSQGDKILPKLVYSFLHIVRKMAVSPNLNNLDPKEKRDLLSLGMPISNFIVYIGVHAQGCIFSGFGQMHNDIYPPLQCHTEYFHCPKHPRYSTYPSLYPTSTSCIDISLFPQFFLFQHIIQLEPQTVQPFQTSFTQ